MEAKLYLPTLVYSGRGIVRKHAKELCGLGTKAMLVTGHHSSRKNGSLADVQAALTAGGVPFVVFDGIEENPSVETVAAAAEIAKQEQVDFFIGIGGGSPMDASKAISLLACNPAVGTDILYEKTDLPAYPVAEVPTTSGTGSEVTPYAILTRHAQRTKKSIAHLVYPKLALVDAAYLRTASRSSMISTCVDALAHLIESWLNTNSNDYNRLYTREGLRLWGSVKSALLQPEGEGRFLEDTDYETFMHASLLAGMAITHTGTSLPHGLSYPVTYELGVPHGKAVGIFLPGFLYHYDSREAVDEVLDLLGFTNVAELEAYLQQLLGRVEIPEELWQRDMDLLLGSPDKLKNYPFEMNRDILASYR